MRLSRGALSRNGPGTSKSEVKMIGVGSRYPNRGVIYSLPNWRAASWRAFGDFIGFRGGVKMVRVFLKKLAMSSTCSYRRVCLKV